MIEEIVKEWNVYDCPRHISQSVWGVKETFVLKEYSDRNMLNRNIQMHKVLHKAGIPVPEILPLPDGKEFYEKSNKMYIMMNRLKGKNIADIDQLDESWFFEFGVILAKLHVAFLECEKSISFRYKSLLDEMEGWVGRELDNRSPEFVTKYDIKKTIHQLSQVEQRLPKQLIHRDVHLGNFLFEDRKFSGYIDFDLSQCNIRIFDICYFLLGIRMKIENDKENDKRWFHMIRKVIEGYHSLSNLKQIERQSIACVMKNIELLFMAYFLRRGDEKLAKDSADLFLFVRDNEEEIMCAVSVLSN